MHVLTRIDDRLIHGQVTVGWAKPMNIRSIMVADDAGAADDFRKALIAMAAPADISAKVLSIQSAAEELKRIKSQPGELILLVSSPSDALALVKAGAPIDKINIGGLHFAPGKKKYLDALFLDDKDIQAIESLLEMGIDVEYRPLPGDSRVDVGKLLAI